MKVRSLVGVIVVAAVTVAALSLFLFSGCGSGKPKLYIYNWTYYIPEEVISDFEKRFNVEVVYVTYASNEEMYAKLRASGGTAGYDLVFPSGGFTSIMIREGMLEEIDKSRIPNLTHIDTTFLEKVTFDPGLKFSVPYAIGTAGISVNKDKIKDFERSWRIFEHPSAKGRLTLLDDMREVMGAALATLGYSVNSINAEELDSAKALVMTWKNNATKFDSESFGKGFASGEFWISHGYAENVFTELDDNMRKKSEFIIPTEGGPMYIDNIVILKGARNIDLAYQFINYIHEPETYARIMDVFELPSINVPARDHMKNKPHYSIEDLARLEFKEDLGEHLEMYNRIWQEIRIGK